MLSRVKQFIQILTREDAPTEARLDAELAAAALLVEIARADAHADPAEMEAIWNLLSKEFGLSDGEAQALLDEAIEHADSATCLYTFTDAIKSSFNREQRVQLIAHLWHVAFADGQLDPYEEASIRKIADLLYVSHSDFIRTKLQALPQTGE